MANERVQAIVIGAGISGLCAARHLVARGASVKVLEARDRVGGRTLSTELAGDWIDLGGQWFGPTQDRAYALARELGLETFPQYDRGKKIIDLGGKVRTFSGLIPNIPLLDRFGLGLAIAAVERHARAVPRSHPSRAKRAKRWDALTVEDWIGDHVRGAAARAVFRIGVQMVLAAETRDLSFLYFLHYLRTGGGLLRALSLRGGAQQDRVSGGMQQVSQRLADGLGDRVTLGAPVRSVEQREDGVRVRTDGGDHDAERVIVALSPRLCEKIAFEPGLPARRIELQRGMPMGRVIKCVVAYKRAFWREAGFSGEVITDGPLLRAVFDDSSSNGRHAALVAFIVGDAAVAANELSDEQRQKAVINDLVRFFGADASRPLAYVDRSWLSEQWSEGCYAGILGPGVMTAAGETLREPVGRIHFAGTEAATRWAGYIEGAIESGERAAQEIADLCRR